MDKPVRTSPDDPFRLTGGKQPNGVQGVCQNSLLEVSGGVAHAIVLDCHCWHCVQN